MTPVLLLLFLVDTPPGVERIQEPPKALKMSEPKLTGTWTAVAILKEGDKLAPAKLHGLVVTITAGSITIQDPFSTESGTLKLDRGVQPKTIDILSEKAPKDKPVLGVYDLAGDTLKIAWTRSGSPRPRSVEMDDCKPDDLKVTTFLVLKRKK